MAASNPWTDTPSIPRPSATSAANCSVPVHPGRADGAVGRQRARRRHPHRARRLAALHRPARGHALWRRRRRRRRCRAGPLYARHAAQRPGLHRRRQHPDLQLRHRPAGNHGPRRAHPHADRQHRRPAHRQGQFRAARYQGPRLAHRLDAGEPMDGRWPTACATATWRCSKMAASAWWPTDFTSPTKSGSTPASNGCTS